MKKMKKMFILLSVVALVGCQTTDSPDVGDLNLHQPSTLRLKAGTRVQTEEGVYRAQTNEVWHSDKRFRTLERKVYNQIYATFFRGVPK
jgi:hypothetical protein